MMDLPSLLRAQDDNLSQMQGLLAEEFDLLKAHRALALPALADRKQQLLVAIETLDKTLAELPDLKQQLSAFPTQLQSLQAKLEACQEQNNRCNDAIAVYHIEFSANVQTIVEVYIVVEEIKR